MSRYNLFSGNKTITKTVAKALGFQIDKDTHFGWFTKDIYFQKRKAQNTSKKPSA